jgi:hypothetical protein
MKSIQPTEQQIQKTIMDYLKLRGYYVQRLNSGRMAYEYKGRNSFINLNAAGTPDIMAFKEIVCLCVNHETNHDLKLYFIEVKRPGKKATPLQIEKMKELEKYGARCIVATCIEDLTLI